MRKFMNQRISLGKPFCLHWALTGGTVSAECRLFFKDPTHGMDPIVNTAASSAAAAGPDVQPWQVPSLLQRAAMLETWAEERSVNAGHQQTGSKKSELTGPPERKSFKFGSCSKCGCARSAHAFSANSSAERRGQAYVICNRWFRFDASGERLCWEMQKASGSEFKKFPKFQKQKYGDSS